MRLASSSTFSSVSSDITVTSGPARTLVDGANLPLLVEYGKMLKPYSPETDAHDGNHYGIWVVAEVQRL